MTLEPTAAAIEHDIDEACKAHPLVTLPYADAVLHLLTFVDLEGVAESSRLNPQERSIRLGLTVSALKYAIRWLALYSSQASAPLNTFSKEAFRYASDLLQQAESYLMINAAYSWAHRDVIDLAAQDGRLTMSFRVPNDDRYEAYDMLIKPSVSLGRGRAEPDLTPLRSQIAKCFDRNLMMGAIPTARNVLSAAYAISSEVSAAYYLLPRDWRLGEFAMRDFEAVNSAVRAILYGWLFATDLAASVDHSYVRDMPLKLRRAELIAAVKDVTGLSKNVVKHIVSLLTYSRAGAATSDPALQPLIAVGIDEFILSSRLVLGGSPERNLIALINTRHAERARYDRLKNEKEALMRARLEAGKPAYCRSWHGSVSGRKDLPDVDYSLFDERTGTLLIAELKWFVAPDETRELADRSEDVRTGVKQCKSLLLALNHDRSLIKQFKTVSDVQCIVVSANSIGMSYAQDEDVPVINEDHLREELAHASGLDEVIVWLRTRQYLPEPSRDYESVSLIVPFFSWELEWYGFKPLVKGRFMPLSVSQRNCSPAPFD